MRRSKLSVSSQVDKEQGTLTKRSGSVYNEYNTNAMQWAHHTNTKPGDVKVFYNPRQKGWVEVMATDDGYVENHTLTGKELEAAYGRNYKKSRNNDELAGELRAIGGDGRSGDAASGIAGKYSEDGGLVGEQTLQGKRGGDSQSDKRDSAGDNLSANEAPDKGASSVSRGKFSVSSQTDSEYLELAKDPKKNSVQLAWMVYKAAKDAGYTFRGMHGTENTSGFTVFKGDLIFNSDSEDVAHSYSGRRGKVYNTYIDTTGYLTVDGGTYNHKIPVPQELRKFITDKNKASSMLSRTTHWHRRSTSSCTTKTTIGSCGSLSSPTSINPPQPRAKWRFSRQPDTMCPLR